MGAVKHTPGPWRRDAGSGLNCDIRAAFGRKVALTYGLSSNEHRMSKEGHARYRAECDANAHRIVVCVNACEGIADPAELRQQRDELLKSLQNLLPLLGGMRIDDSRMRAIYDARAVVAKTTGAAAPATAAEDEQGEDDHVCSGCFCRGCNGECGGDDLMGAGS